MQKWDAYECLKSYWGGEPQLDISNEIMASKNKLINRGEVITFSIGKGCYDDLNGDIIFATVYTYEDHCNADSQPINVRCWKFVPAEQMMNDNNFDTMDWRDNLEDPRSLSVWNFFHPTSLKEFFDSIRF